MSWKDTATDISGMSEREFVLERDGNLIPGVVWSPLDGADAGRVLLLGHGGTANKKADYIQEVARLAVSHGMQAVAIDGPGHGERAFPDIKAQPEFFAEAWDRGGGTEGIVADWQATLDFVEAQYEPRPVGWWGLSMGTMMGLPVTVAEPRISVAVLGLMGGWGPNGDDLLRLAPQLDRPLRFLVQWDDEIVPRDACLELFTAIGSERKTLHANPGAHSAVPTMEVIASLDYLNRYLG